jgi:hypothetical protein
MRHNQTILPWPMFAFAFVLASCLVGIVVADIEIDGGGDEGCENCTKIGPDCDPKGGSASGCKDGVGQPGSVACCVNLGLVQYQACGIVEAGLSCTTTPPSVVASGNDGACPGSCTSGCPNNGTTPWTYSAAGCISY